MGMAVALMLAAALSSAAEAGCPPAGNSIAAELERSHYVMTATVLSETRLDNDLGANYVVKPVEALKGYPPEELLLFSENSAARFPMEVGATYLLFVQAHSDIEASYFFVDNCANSGLLGERGPVLGEVRRLVSVRIEASLGGIPGAP